MPRNLMFMGAAAIAVGAVAWFALKGGPGSVPPDRDPQGPGPIASTTAGDPAPVVPFVPPDAPPEEVVRAYLEKIRALPWDKMDALGEGQAYEFVMDPEAVRALAVIAATEGEPDDRAAALMVLGWSRLPIARSVLESALDGAYGPEFQTAAVWSLANAEPNWAVPLLRDTAVRSKDLFVATTAFQALLLQEGQGALDAFADALDRAQDDAARRTALYAILGGQDPAVTGEEPRLIRLHRAGMPHLFEAPDEIPAEFHDAVNEVLKWAAGERDPRITHAAARAVLRIPGGESHRTLGELWEKGDPGLRQMVLTQVNPGRPDGHFPELLRRLPRTKDREARDTASLILGEVHDPAFLPNLQTWHDAEGDKEIRARIKKAIQRLQTN